MSEAEARSLRGKLESINRVWVAGLRIHRGAWQLEVRDETREGMPWVIVESREQAVALWSELNG